MSAADPSVPQPPESPRRDDWMTLSEERLDVATRVVPTGRAVLRRRIVTERRTIEVEVRREEAVLELLPLDGTEPSGASHLALPELVLHEEQVVVVRRIVPVERVRLQVTPVTEQQQVVDDVRRERLVDDDLPTP